MALGLLTFLLLVAGCLAQDDFNELPELYKTGVELALQQLHAHSGIQHHFRFFKSLSKSDSYGGFGVSYPYHHFHLKATRCRKGTVASRPKDCVFRNDRPLIDCVTCYKTYQEKLEQEPKPFIHCIHRPKLTKDMIAQREQKCKDMSYSSGSATMLLVKSDKN